MEKFTMQIKKSILALFALSILLSPATSLAEFRAGSSKPESDGKVRTLSEEPNTGATFCTRITESLTAVSAKLNQNDSRLREKRAETQNKLQERKAERQKAISQKRTETVSNTEAKLKELEIDATAEQKVALQEFKTTLNTAQTTRKAAIDAAMQTYRAGLDKLVLSRQDAAKAAAATFKTSVNAAIQKAKADCAAKVDPKTVRETFNASMRAAQEQLRTDMKNIEKPGQGVEALAKVRNEAVRKAHDEFRTTMKAAHDKLKAAFATTDSEEEQE
jgi:hypothetical protein